MLISNMELIPGRRVVEHLGLVQGSSVRAKPVGRDIMAGLKNIFGGELKGYTELLTEAREAALLRMQQQAESLGTNAVVNVRFSTSSVAQRAASAYDPAAPDFEARQTYREAMIVVLDALSAYIRRYAALARESRATPARSAPRNR